MYVSAGSQWQCLSAQETEVAQKQKTVIKQTVSGGGMGKWKCSFITVFHAVPLAMSLGGSKIYV